MIILTYSLDFLIDTGKGARQNISIFEFEPYNATYVVVTFSLTHKGNFTIVLRIIKQRLITKISDLKGKRVGIKPNADVWDKMMGRGSKKQNQRCNRRN